MHRCVLAVSLALLTGACATLPTKTLSGSATPEDISTSLVTRLVCEVQQANPDALRALQGLAPSPAASASAAAFSSRLKSNKDLAAVLEAAPRLTPAPPQKPKKYDISVQLTLKAETTSGLTPTLNFIHPFSTADTSRTAIIGGEFTRSGSRTVTENFGIDPSKVSSDDCDKVAKTLRGTFGVTHLIDHEMLRKDLPPAVTASVDSDDIYFGSTIEFSVKRGINGGPHWIRTHFVGPSEDGVVNAARTDTNTLVIAFAKPDETSGTGGKPVNNARALLNQMILQNVGILPR